ncbi:MAG: biotin--[acetyl-CoA-carboxylase] ligase [Candidatus Aureabacteria bacterium]|nr:biotin--[acetyl-CoA-carboxylase] ligase [Candidatus Auribacterota bacterium]
MIQAKIEPGEKKILERLLKGEKVSCSQIQPFQKLLDSRGFVTSSENDMAFLKEVKDQAFPYLVQFFPLKSDFIREVVSFLEIESTNDFLRENRSRFFSTSAVFTESQTRGKGKSERSWFMKKGKSLIFSLLLKVSLKEREHAGLLTLATSVAVAGAAADASGVLCQCKWPNDVLINDKKICGVLTESAQAKNDFYHIIIGIGINVNYGKEDFPVALRGKATSLMIESGKFIHRYGLFQSFSTRFSFLYKKFLSGDFSAITEKWNEMAAVRNVM